MTLVKRNGRSTAMPTIWDNFFDRDLFNWDNNFTNSGSSTPAVNIKETPDNFLVEMAAPGMEKQDFKIELDGSALTISSEKQTHSEQKDGENYNRKEFNYQSFYRTFHLPKEVVNADKIMAKYENGILRVEIPKHEQAKQKPARLIDVK
ncbi:MAG: Hsp20/alpha crystallin family protein [Bacteroidota bacterium]|nr:Hsp20/alpha crystallin family protein [Bacteroidota bacterium]